jgi:hypothetical protein
MMFWDMSNYPSYSVGLNLDTKIWEELPAPPPLSDPHNQIVCKAATDPTTNRVYIPGCSSNGTSMLMYDPSLKSSTALAMPSKGNDTIWSGYTFIWNDVRRSFLLYGGMISQDSPYFYEYIPTDANPWRTLVIVNKHGYPILFADVPTLFHPRICSRNLLLLTFFFSLSLTHFHFLPLSHSLSFSPSLSLTLPLHIQDSSGTVPPILMGSCMVAGNIMQNIYTNIFAFTTFCDTDL